MWFAFWRKELFFDQKMVADCVFIYIYTAIASLIPLFLINNPFFCWRTCWIFCWQHTSHFQIHNNCGLLPSNNDNISSYHHIFRSAPVMFLCQTLVVSLFCCCWTSHKSPDGLHVPQDLVEDVDGNEARVLPHGGILFVKDGFSDGKSYESEWFRGYHHFRKPPCGYKVRLKLG